MDAKQKLNREGKTMKIDYTGMNMDQIKRAEAAHTALFEATTKVDGFFIADLRVAFDKVAHPDGWKLPIHVDVSDRALGAWEAEGITVEMIDAGITYFQGCVATIKHGPASNYIRIVSPGYVC